MPGDADEGAAAAAVAEAEEEEEEEKRRKHSKKTYLYEAENGSWARRSGVSQDSLLTTDSVSHLCGRARLRRTSETHR